MKNYLKKIFKKIVEPIIQLECSVTEYFVSSAHKRLKWIQWRIPPQPEHFDHSIDLYYQWKAKRNPHWLERGVFGNLVFKNGNTLELSCGDGFNARNFYSLRSKKVIACDFDPSALKTARGKNMAPNVEYVLSDIRDAMPKGNFDNVFWDNAIEHFTREEIEKILSNIKIRLNPQGVLSGCTIVEKKSGEKSLSHHEYEFKNKEDLLGILKPYFKNVKVFETIFPDRHNLYFWASQDVLPFDHNWAHSISTTQ